MINNNINEKIGYNTSVVKSNFSGSVVSIIFLFKYFYYI